MGNRHLIAGQGNAIIVINRNIDHFFDLADGTTRERFVLPHANAEPDAEKGVSVEIMDHTRLKAIGLDDVFDGQTPQVRVLRHPHPTHTRSHATARRTPDSRMHRARTTHAPRTQARDADREAQDLAPQVAPLARARGRGTDLASRRRVPRRRPLAVRLPGERGAARAPGGKSTRRRWLVDFTSRVDCGKHSVLTEDDALAVATFSTWRGWLARTREQVRRL